MARFCGVIGFVRDEEVAPGVWKEVPVERTYYGDVIKASDDWSAGTGVNDNFGVRNRVSILADDFAYDNMYAMRYVHFMGKKFKITDCEIQRPRLILSIGGLYNAHEN